MQRRHSERPVPQLSEVPRDAVLRGSHPPNDAVLLRLAEPFHFSTVSRSMNLIVCHPLYMRSSILDDTLLRPLCPCSSGAL